MLRNREGREEKVRGEKKRDCSRRKERVPETRKSKRDRSEDKEKHKDIHYTAKSIWTPNHVFFQNHGHLSVTASRQTNKDFPPDVSCEV